MLVFEDAAHCLEGRLNGEKPGAHSDATIFSFYATKNLTCGEGGAVITNNDDLAAGIVPPPQIAAIETERRKRDALAKKYRDVFTPLGLRMPHWRAGIEHAHCLFPIHVDPAFRDRAMNLLNDHGVGATINFRSVPTMAFCRDKYGYTPDMFPVSYDWGEGAISLPLFPAMTAPEQYHVIQVVRDHLVAH